MQIIRLTRENLIYVIPNFISTSILIMHNYYNFYCSNNKLFNLFLFCFLFILKHINVILKETDEIIEIENGISVIDKSKC